MFGEPTKFDSLNCWDCKSKGKSSEIPHLYRKEQDIRLCVACGSILEEEREVLPGVTSSWFDAKWTEDVDAAERWQHLGVTVTRADGAAGGAVREVLDSQSTYPYRDAIISSPFQPGLLSGSDVVTLDRLQHRLQQEKVIEAGFLPFPDPDSQEMGDLLAKQCFEAMSLYHWDISDMGVEAHLFKSKSGKPLKPNTPAEDLVEVFAPLRPFTEIEHPGLGITVSVELSHVFKDDGMMIPYAIYNQCPSVEIPEHRKREMLGDLALQALYHGVDEGCLVLFSQPEGETNDPAFAVLKVEGLRNYLLETTEQWFESAPELSPQLSRFALRTAANTLHSEWQEEYL